MSNNKYEELSQERKSLQADGEAPDWLSTAGYQILKGKEYLDQSKQETPKGMHMRMAKRAAELTKFEIPSDFGYENWEEAFFDVIWKGWLSPSTPIQVSFGNNRGHPVSCSGTYCGDSIRSFYEMRTELAQLTQRGYGTSVVLDDVRPRGSEISKGGTANGVMPVVKGVVQDMMDVSQGNQRRGSSGIYLDLMHDDFGELAAQIISDDDGLNVGWNVTDEFEKLFETDPEKADHIFKTALKAKMTKGKGYFFFKDKANRLSPQMYKDRGFKIRASNLCSEIMLMSDKDHSFTCVLSSVNVAKYDEWKDTKLIQISIVFLDAIIEDMLFKAKQEVGFERIIAFTEKSRALGLGVMGFTSYLQNKRWVFGDFDSMQFNSMFFKKMQEETFKASELLAEELGEPEWMKGYGRRNSHTMAIAPTMSTSLILGGVSQGIEPVFANVFEQDTAGGSVYRINPEILNLMKDRGHYDEKTMKRIAEDNGSVQGESWLSDEEKLVFRTAFEVPQDMILKMASVRQRWIDQGQSLNLYFDAETPEDEIARLHHTAFVDPYIKGLYYVRSLNGVAKHKADKDECLSCHG